MQIDIQPDYTLGFPQRRPRRRPWLPLLSALLQLAGGNGEIVRHKEKSWASVTFAGTRHTIVMVFIGGEAVTAGEDYIASLPDHEFSIPGQMVADASVVHVDHALLPEPRLQVEVELLLIEDC